MNNTWQFGGKWKLLDKIWKYVGCKIWTQDIKVTKALENNKQKLSWPGIEHRITWFKQAHEKIKSKEQKPGSNRGWNGCKRVSSKRSAPLIEVARQLTANARVERVKGALANGFDIRRMRGASDAETLAIKCRRRLVEVSTVFSGQPGGEDLKFFPELNNKHIDRKVSSWGSRISHYLDLIHHVSSRSKQNISHVQKLKSTYLTQISTKSRSIYIRILSIKSSTRSWQ